MGMIIDVAAAVDTGALCTVVYMGMLEAAEETLATGCMVSLTSGFASTTLSLGVDDDASVPMSVKEVRMRDSIWRRRSA